MVNEKEYLSVIVQCNYIGSVLKTRLFFEGFAEF